LAALIYGFLAYMQPLGLSTQAAVPAANSVAEKAGLLGGDEITLVNGDEIKNWNEVSWALIKARLFRDDLAIQVKRNEQNVSLEAISSEDMNVELGPALSRELGFLPVEKSVIVRAVGEGSAAESAGFMVNDTLISVDGTPVQTSAQFTELVKQ